MRIKLSIKLFGAFFLILAIVAGAMIFSRYLFARNFENYIHQTELERLERLVPALQSAYRLHNDWSSIVNDERRWNRMMHDLLTDRHGPPLPAEPGPPGGPGRILLLDANHRPVFGVPGPGPQDRMVPISIEGRVVGWLGLNRHAPFKTGPPADLMERQTRQLYLVGGVVIALTAMIAFLFSRHLLKPIHRLIQGTRQLAGRDFSVRITSATGDELSQLADHFNAMAGTLEEFEKMRRQWLTDISHELRTPLAVLRGEIEAIQDGVRQPTPDNLASLHAEILRISRLVEDLHRLSLADAGQLHLSHDRIVPTEILDRIVQGFQGPFARRGISLSLRLAPLAGRVIDGDADRLAQVFANLMDNALKYVVSPGRLVISGSAGDNELVIFFQDSGPGVPSAALPRLFDRLFRVDPSRNRETGGSGLGLSICRQIIERHGGRMWAQPSPLGGLSIGIGLPIYNQRK